MKYVKSTGVRIASHRVKFRIRVVYSSHRSLNKVFEEAAFIVQMPYSLKYPLHIYHDIENNGTEAGYFCVVLLTRRERNSGVNTFDVLDVSSESPVIAFGVFQLLLGKI